MNRNDSAAVHGRRSTRRWIKRVSWILAILLVLAYAGVCVWLRVNETRLVFSRTMHSIPPSPSLALNEQRVEFGDLDGTKLYAWLVSSLPKDTANVWLMFFHGSGDNVSVNQNAYDDYRSMGFNVMAPEYPGYPGSPGVPSEAGVEREAQAAFEYLRSVKQVPAKNIVIFGASLGSAIAIDLASRVDAGALIVASGLASVVATGQKAYPILPIRLLLRNPFESTKKIGRARMPVLVIHSVADERFPLAENGQRLYELASSPKQFLKIRGEHGEGVTHATVNPNFYSDIVTFLNTQAGFRLRRPLPSIAPVLSVTIDTAGIEAALAQHRSLSRENPRRYNFREPELNHLGYYLLQKKKINEAIAIFQLNAEQFPQSFNVFDSLGDAYVAAGNDTEAIESYRHALALFPGEGNHIRVKLDRLRSKPRGD